MRWPAISVAVAAVCFQTASAKLQFGGVNLAGFDFGGQIDGSVDDKATPPDNAQIQHFVSNGLNAFRLPVGWNFLVNYAPKPDKVDPGQLAKYDDLVQACISQAKLCLIDVHNYAHYDGAAIGEGSATVQNFVDLWTAIATKYANVPNVAFGLMNEPHDIDLNAWKDMCNKAISAIRAAGAKTQYITVSGDNYASAGAFVGPAADIMSKVVETDGTTDKIIFEVHKYYDPDNEGKVTKCSQGDQVKTAFGPLADWLTTNKRKAFFGEFGGGSGQDCIQQICGTLNFINSKSDVFLGFTSWSAGSFKSDYELSESPQPGADGPMTDVELVKQAIYPSFVKGSCTAGSEGIDTGGGSGGGGGSYSGPSNSTTNGTAKRWEMEDHKPALVPQDWEA